MASLYSAAAKADSESMRTLFASVLFLGCAGACYCGALRSWGGGVFVYLGEERAPAAVRKLDDYSQLKSDALSQTVERQLLATAEVQKRDGQVGIHLGNPLLKLEDGTAGFGCRVRGRNGLYDRVELTFVGVGISSGGESAKMVVEAACEAMSTPEAMDPVWIPVGEIMKAAAKDADYVYGDGDAALRIQLLDIPGEWPPSWTLVGLRLTKKDSLNSLSLSGEKVRAARAAMLSFDL